MRDRVERREAEENGLKVVLSEKEESGEERVVLVGRNGRAREVAEVDIVEEMDKVVRRGIRVY